MATEFYSDERDLARIRPTEIPEVYVPGHGWVNYPRLNPMTARGPISRADAVLLLPAGKPSSELDAAGEADSKCAPVRA